MFRLVLCQRLDIWAASLAFPRRSHNMGGWWHVLWTTKGGSICGSHDPTTIFALDTVVWTCWLYVGMMDTTFRNYGRQ